MTTYNDQISSYISSLFANEDSSLQRAREESPKRGLPTINIKPEEGRFLQFLACASGARKAVEIGTLGGYSGIWIARGLQPGGKLFTLDKEKLHASVAQENFTAAGLDEVVDSQVGNAHELLQQLSDQGPFDFVFIDAEKSGYPAYFEWALENVRIGGIIAAHNAFRGGSIVGQRADDEYSELMRNFNQQVADEPRLISTIFPAGDGTLVAVKIA